MIFFKMRFYLFLVLLLFSFGLEAKTYYINKGVKYHIGDNRYSRSEDSDFVGAYPVVGQEWIQAFQMDRPDQVKVHIDQIWGVDDCDYCKVMISIDDHEMLRLSKVNNHEAVDTLEPLAAVLQPGVTHYLKIASYGGASVDDLIIQDVSVESQAVIRLLEPGPILKQPLEPMPVFKEPEVIPTPVPFVKGMPCKPVAPKAGWIPGEMQGRSGFDLVSKDRNAQDSGVLGKLASGESIEFYFQTDGFPIKRELVGSAVEILLQTPSRDGWVISFLQDQGPQLHGNMRRNGVYRSESFSAGPYQASAWNKVRLQSCSDGFIHLFVNNSEASQAVAAGPRPFPFLLRAVGLGLHVSKTPQAAPALVTDPLLQAPGNF